MREIILKTPSMASKIYIGTDAIEKRLPLLTQGQSNFVVADSNVYSLYAPFFEKYFLGAEIFVLPAGEENKNCDILFSILEKMAGAGMRRTSRLFIVGGGVAGDIGGLAASLYMRGIFCVQIPTTLLSQVDSSVGGKTAVDLNGVKNIVGAFYQPQEVLINPNFLSTLPKKEIKCGLGEIVKYAALNFDIFTMLWENKERLSDLAFLSDCIYACVEHKRGVVQADEKETGERKSLNIGHTTGHAIELVHGLSHGESVLYGMAIETQIAIEKGVCEKEYGEKLLKLIKIALALEPVTNPVFSKIEEYVNKAAVDKKNEKADSVVLSVAKSEKEWTLLTLPKKEYALALQTAIEKL